MAAPLPSSEVPDGPVLSVINKRIRALRKKYNRIIQMEESLSQGKVLNKEQEETLRSKSFVLAGIEELEKLKQPLSLAVSEEISAVLQRQQIDAPTSAIDSTAAAAEPEPATHSNKEETDESQEPEKSDGAKKFETENGNPMVEDLLNLLYFGSMFDVKSQHDFTATMLTRTHERGCCLSYDYVTDDDASDFLGERDLDLISMLGGLLISRPVNSSLSHKSAILRCIEHAKLWLSNSDQPIQGDSTITYASLREKLNKIMSSDYFTTTPEIKAPVEVAAAAETYGSFQVPVHGTVVSVDSSVKVQGSTIQYEQQLSQEEMVVNCQGEGGVYRNQTDPVEELKQGDEGQGLGFPETPDQTDSLVQSEVEQVPQEFDKGHHYGPRRPYQNHRGGRGMGGGGRRGYPNGRGGRGGNRGGGYSNGRQYYDYQRNYYRGRGGRGGSYPGQGSYLVGDE